MICCCLSCGCLDSSLSVEGFLMLNSVSQSDSVLLMVELCSSEQSNYFSASDTMTDIQLVHLQDGAPHISVYEDTHTHL